MNIVWGGDDDGRDRMGVRLAAVCWLLVAYEWATGLLLWPENDNHGGAGGWALAVALTTLVGLLIGLAVGILGGLL